MRRDAFLSDTPIRNLYDIYTIEDADTPESIALSLYGATTYHWVIMLSNEIHNPYLDWPIDQNVINYYCEKKYGVDTDGELLMLKVSHYEYDNQIIGEYEHPVAGKTRQPRPAALFDKTPAYIRRHAPSLGEHSEEILTELGYDAEQVGALLASGVIRSV